MTTKNFYEILDTNSNATPEEIELHYKWKAGQVPLKEKEEELSVARSLSNNYNIARLEQELKTLQEQLSILREAYEALSNPLKRQAYDASLRPKQVIQPQQTTPITRPTPVPTVPNIPLPPDITVSQTNVDFGKFEQGVSQVEAFVITNKGGPVKKVNVDWEDPKPDWGELVIEPDPVNILPMRVSVRINTGATIPGMKMGNIKVSVD